jgi:hypothetical protein
MNVMCMCKDILQPTPNAFLFLPQKSRLWRVRRLRGQNSGTPVIKGFTNPSFRFTVPASFQTKQFSGIKDTPSLMM